MKYKIHRIIVFGLIGFAIIILFSSTFQFEYLKKIDLNFQILKKERFILKECSNHLMFT
jgi:hypothetical protein